MSGALFGDDTILEREEKAQADMFRDIFGNPFLNNPFPHLRDHLTPLRFFPLHSTWLTSDVLALARGIYAERAFDRMPILADALQDAGCNNDDVLNHCRDANQVHVRGCWVVDLLLGK